MIGSIVSHDKQVYLAPRTTWDLHNTRNFPATVTYTPVAQEHFLYATTGYNGSKPHAKPMPNHDFEYIRDKIHAYRNYNRVYHDAQGGSIFGSGPALSTNPGSVQFEPALDYTNVYNRALDKLNDKARGNLDLSIDIAEYHQTAKMLRVKDQVLDFTKTFFRRKFGAIKAIANLRLQYMYGVKPLLSSIYDAADESMRIVINRSQRFRVRATDPGYRVNTVGVYYYYGQEVFKATDVRIKLTCTLGVTLTQQDFDISRWTSMNPVSIAWELMPYSFVVDWFLNVGGYLRNLETALLYDNRFQTGYRTDFAAFEGSFARTDIITANPPGSDSFSGDFTGLRFHRKLLTSYPLPNLPSIQADLGSSRLLNGAALLAQHLGKR